MRTDATSHDLRTRNGEVSLAGSIWFPSVPARAAVLMHPGSGPSDRNNDVYFPPIRAHLLQRGVAVCSFDKRGVGGSTGRWQEAGIPEQADDVLAAIAALEAELGPGIPTGLFGHSQGGWVVVEAAGRGAPVALVVVNSGPGVSPGEQERYAFRTNMRRSSLDPAHVDAATRAFDEVIELMRAGVPLDEVRSRLASAGFDDDAVFEATKSLPDDRAEWDLWLSIIDYDPRLALSRINVPVLTLFGRDDAIVPVDESVAVYRQAVRPELFTVAVLPGGDHRLQSGRPPRPVDGYLETLSSFIDHAIAT
jgi:hypothetical protein